MHSRDLLPFFAISFAIAWGILGLYLLAAEAMAEYFGSLSGSHPLFYLAVWAPAIAALSLVVYRHGLAGLRGLLSRLLLWRASLYWYLCLLLILPLVFYTGALFKPDSPTQLFPFTSLSAYLLALGMMAIKGPIEELGWRGLALPLLQRHMAPIWAALLLGAIWAIWHLPAFLLSGTPQSSWSLLPFLIGTIALSLILTPLYNASGGSILLPALFHLQLINPLWPDAQPYDSGLFLVLALVLTWLNRKTLFSRQGGLTQVLPDHDRP